jgi:hypothetical protein
MSVRVEDLARLREGSTLADAQSALGTREKPAAEQDGSMTVHVLKAPEHGVEVFFKDDDENVIDTVTFEPPFSGAVRGVRIGATKEQVERMLGRPQRLWPVQDGIDRWLYEEPEFIRVDFDPQTDTVRSIYR